MAVIEISPAGIAEAQYVTLSPVPRVGREG